MADVAKDNLVKALVVIARGRDDNGRALSGHKAQEIARDTLFALDLDWSRTGEQMAAALDRRAP
jgi:hypothetical protein